MQCPFKTHVVAFWLHENNEDKFENDIKLGEKINI